MINLGIRNFKLYIRDKGQVFFSFLGVLVIIGLYVLFLGNNMQKSFDGLTGAKELIDSWVMAGIIAVASITTGMGAFSIMVEDQTKKNQKDFMSSPLKRYEIVGGYIFSGFLVSLVMSLITFVAAEGYLLTNGGNILSFSASIKVFGVILLSAMASSSMVLFLASFLKTTGAFSNASILLGTLIGFITGIYLPIGTLSEKVQLIVKGFPISHASLLLRRILMEEEMKTTFQGAPAHLIEEFRLDMGLTFQYGDTTCTTGAHIAILLLTALVFFALAIINISRKQK